MRERETRAKHLQMVSGLHFATYWLANFMGDLVNFLIPCAGILITFLIFNEDGLVSADQQGRFVLVFLLYAWAMLPLMYLLSYLFTVPSSGFTRIAMFNIFFGNPIIPTAKSVLIINYYRVNALKLNYEFH